MRTTSASFTTGPSVQPKRKIAFILGGADCVWDDLESARELCSPDVVCCVNDIGVDYSGPVDHWVSYHADLLMKLIPKRRKHGYADATNIWMGTARYRAAPAYFRVHNARGGSSGLLATRVILDRTDVSHTILCGVPISASMPHYHGRDNKAPWEDARFYWKHWRESLPILRGRVRSMSGWTAELLGRPDKEWLEA